MYTVEQEIARLLRDPLVPYHRGNFSSAEWGIGDRLFFDAYPEGFCLLPGYRSETAAEIRLGIWANGDGTLRKGSGPESSGYTTRGLRVFCRHSDSTSNLRNALAGIAANPRLLIHMLSAKSVSISGIVWSPTNISWPPNDYEELDTWTISEEGLSAPCAETEGYRPARPVEPKYPFSHFVEELMKAGCLNSDLARLKQRGCLAEDGQSIMYASRDLVRSRAGYPDDTVSYTLTAGRADGSIVTDYIGEDYAKLTHDEREQILALLTGREQEILIGGAKFHLKTPIGLYAEAALAE